MEKFDKFQIPCAALLLLGSAYAFHKIRDERCRVDEKTVKTEEKGKKEKTLDEHAIAQKVWQDRIDRLYL